MPCWRREFDVAYALLPKLTAIFPVGKKVGQFDLGRGMGAKVDVGC